MNFYTVRYLENGREKSEQAHTVNAGAAFAQVLKGHPECKLLGAECSGAYRDGEGYTSYEPPVVQRELLKGTKPARSLNRKELGCEFPFYNEVKAPRKI